MKYKIKSGYRAWYIANKAPFVPMFKDGEIVVKDEPQFPHNAASNTVAVHSLDGMTGCFGIPMEFLEPV